MKRDYDEEEKTSFEEASKAHARQKSSSDEEEDDDRSRGSSPERIQTRISGSATEDTDLQQVDMEMSD